MATILDGKALGGAVQAGSQKSSGNHGQKTWRPLIIVGNNPASRVYVNSKRKDCEECGFFSEEYALPEETTQGSSLHSLSS